MDQLTKSAYEALIRETNEPGAFVPLWKIAERMSRPGPQVPWPQLVPAVNALEEAGLVKVGRRGLAGGAISAYAGLRFQGVIIFDPETGSRIVPGTPSHPAITMPLFTAFAMGENSAAEAGITFEHFTNP